MTQKISSETVTRMTFAEIAAGLRALGLNPRNFSYADGLTMVRCRKATS